MYTYPNLTAAQDDHGALSDLLGQDQLLFPFLVELARLRQASRRTRISVQPVPMRYPAMDFHFLPCKFVFSDFILPPVRVRV